MLFFISLDGCAYNFHYLYFIDYIVEKTNFIFFTQGVGYNFDFKLAYKFLRRSEARLRYGNATVGAWRGERVEGTYCDRILNDCDLRACRIQSPNFPGVYPRNATCTYRIEHTKVSCG